MDLVGALCGRDAEENYDGVLDRCVLRLKEVMDYALELLGNEINGRSFYYISKWDEGKREDCAL